MRECYEIDRLYVHDAIICLVLILRKAIALKQFPANHISAILTFSNIQLCHLMLQI